jgi:hypothetical protein
VFVTIAERDDPQTLISDVSKNNVGAVNDNSAQLGARAHQADTSADLVFAVPQALVYRLLGDLQQQGFE